MPRTLFRRSILLRGGPRRGPPRPPTLGSPRGTRRAPRSLACSWFQVGGHDRAPHAPRRSDRPGEPGALLDPSRAHGFRWGAPTGPPPPPPPPALPPETPGP